MVENPENVRLELPSSQTERLRLCTRSMRRRAIRNRIPITTAIGSDDIYHAGFSLHIGAPAMRGMIQVATGSHTNAAQNTAKTKIPSRLVIHFIKVSDGYPNLHGTGGDSRLCATRAREVVEGNREVFFPDGKACGLVITITVRPLDQLTMPVRDPLHNSMAGLNVEAA